MSIKAGGYEITGLNPRLGFAAGAGFEYAVGEHATFQTEYTYSQLAKFTMYSDAGVSISDQQSFQQLATGINIRF